MLMPDEPEPVLVLRKESLSPFFLICDHASHRVPRALEMLQVSCSDLLSHIGWDIGAARVATLLSESLQAPLVMSSYSRLVIDCNRPPHVPSAVPSVSGGVRIPKNENLSVEERNARIQTFFRPYHDTIASLLDTRIQRGISPILLSIHSFTPELLGQKRPWHVGLLYGKDNRIALKCLSWLRAEPTLFVGDNEPYRVQEGSDYSIPKHGEERHLLHTAFEIRQDQLVEDHSIHQWAERLHRLCEKLLVD